MLVNVIPYEPQFYVDMHRLPKVGSAWIGVDRILHDIVNRFSIPQKSALEFGVEHGYSTAALANVFERVSGVDTFYGDEHSGIHESEFAETTGILKPWPNITLFQSRFQDYIHFDENHYDLIHVDIVHKYEETYQCGYWSTQHSPVVIFHDTQSYPEVKYAVTDLAHDTGRTFYEYTPCHGVGILVKQ